MATRTATLNAVRPLVGKPTAEAMALARALVDATDIEPSSADPRLEAAARTVARALDDYDRELIARRRDAPVGDPTRTALEEALARRIASQELTAPALGPIRLVVRVADASERMTWPLAEPDASMTGLEPARTKAHAVDMATRDLVVGLAHEPHAENVFYASVSFNDRVTQRRAPRPVTSVPESESFDPTEPGVGRTRIWLGLEAARALVEDFRSTRGPGGAVRTVVVLEAGSACEDPSRTRAAAETICALPDTWLAACVYAPPSDAASSLASVVSDDRLFQVVSNADELRRFLHDAVATAGADATPPAG